jgi:hypothetical protein
VVECSIKKKGCIMFGHKVVDDLNKWNHTHIKKEGKQYLCSLHEAAKLIQNAQHFHLGDPYSLSSTFDKYHERGYGLFLRETSDVRLPFKICWFDWVHESIKGGVLAIEIKPSLMMVQKFVHIIEQKTWLLHSCGYLVQIGAPLLWPQDDISDAPAIHKISTLTRPQWMGERANIWPFPLLEGDLQKGFKFGLIDLTILNIALLLLSCKNIETKLSVPPAALNKKRQKRGKQPLFSYHTLVIKPVGKQQHSIPQDLWHNRIHLARGHFKEYTTDAPLFGKITGRFWWQPQVRGRNRDGMIMKDYIVEPGE